MTLRSLFDQEEDGMAPAGAPAVRIIPASFGAMPDPAEAIIEASPQVELFDEAFWTIPKLWFDPQVTDAPATEAALTAQVRDLVNADALPVCLGADEKALVPTLTGLTKDEPISILHLGARPWLTAANGGEGVMQHLIGQGHKVVAAGLRDLRVEEAHWISTHFEGYTPFLAIRRAPTLSGRVAGQFQNDQPVFIVIDVSVFDASVMPATDRPEPGGLSWSEVVAILRDLSARGQIRGALITGLRPQPDLHAADFLVAKLLYKLLTFVFAPHT